MGLKELNSAARISYILFALLIGMVVWLHLGTLLFISLLGYLALRVFSFRGSKALSVVLYLLVVVIAGAGLSYFASLAYQTLPKVAETAIPAMAEFAERHGIQLPFTDYTGMMNSALAQAKEGIAVLGRYARIASFQTLLVCAGLLVALSIFLHPRWTIDPKATSTTENLFSQVTRELGLRFSELYRSFATVMGAQIVIAAINMALTAIFLLAEGYPYAALLLCLVFLCGLIPILGNLISNAVIVGVGFTMSAKTGIIALVFLVVIHKLEYFLDGTIIGRRIRTPIWLMLIALLLGEKLMGIPGMILAPVMLHFIRCAASEHEPLSAKEVDGPSIHALAGGRSTITTYRPNG